MTTYTDFHDASRANAIAARNAYVEWFRTLTTNRPDGFHKTRPTHWLRRAGYDPHPDSAEDARVLSQIEAWSKIA